MFERKTQWVVVCVVSPTFFYVLSLSLSLSLTHSLTHSLSHNTHIILFFSAQFEQGWKPPFAIDVDKFRFTPRVQPLNELEVTPYICVCIQRM